MNKSTMSASCRYADVSVFIFCLYVLTFSASTGTQSAYTQFREDPGFNLHTPEETVERAQRAHELLPAELDIGGNWGSAVEGLQMSVRMEKQSFARGEPVMAIVLLRNTTDERKTWHGVFGSERDFQYAVMDDRGFPIPRRDADRPYSGSSKSDSLEPRTQRRYRVDLGAMFDLKAAGGFSVSLNRSVWQAGVAEMRSMTSGAAFFQITNPSANVSTNDAVHDPQATPRPPRPRQGSATTNSPAKTDAPVLPKPLTPDSTPVAEASINQSPGDVPTGFAASSSRHGWAWGAALGMAGLLGAVILLLRHQRKASPPPPRAAPAPPPPSGSWR